MKDDQDYLETQLQNLKLKQILKSIQEKQRKIGITSLSKWCVCEIKLKKISDFIYYYVCFKGINENHQTCLEHARTFQDVTLDALQASLDKILESGVEDALQHVINNLIIT